MAIQPSGPISVSSLKNLLGLSYPLKFSDLYGKNQVLPSSGSITMNSTRSLNEGTGFYNAWFTPSNINSNTVGTLADAKISTNNYTISQMVNLQALNSSWRNLIHVSATNSDYAPIGSRCPSLFVVPNSSNIWLSVDTTIKNSYDNGSASTIPLNLMTNIIVTASNKTINLYFNGNPERFTYPDPLYVPSPSSAAKVMSPDGFYTQSNIQMNRLWYYPYFMTDEQAFTLFVKELFAVSTKAYDLGLYGVGPWNKNVVSWPDLSARWLWAESTGNTNVPANYAIFYCYYTNTTGASITGCTLSVSCDNTISSYLNKTLLGSSTDWTATASYTVSLSTGTNLFQFICRNISAGPAGVLFSLKNSIGTVLMRSDNSTQTPLTNSSFTYFSQYGVSAPILYYK